MIGEIFSILKDFFVALFHFYTGPTIIVLIPLVTSVLIAYLYFKVIFKDVDGFQTDLENVGCIPDKNKDYNFAESLWSTEKIGFWVYISIVCASLAYPQAAVWFPHWFAH